MKITKSELKKIIKEKLERILTTEQEEVDVQNLETQAEKIVDTVKSEVAKAGAQMPLLMQLVLTKIGEEAPETTEPEAVDTGKHANYDAIQADLAGQGKVGEVQ